MKILFVTYGTNEAPATRYRVMQYLDVLRSKGVESAAFSAISAFSTRLMLRSPDFSYIGRLMYYIYVFGERIIRFFILLRMAGRFDIIFLQRATFSFGLEKLLKKTNPNIIFDIDDAIYMPDRQARDLLTVIKRYFKETEVINILRISKAVIVENEYISDFVKNYCHSIIKIPGPIDTDRFFVKKALEREKVVIGWIGSPATTQYLHMLDAVFTKLAAKYKNVEFVLMGAGKYANAAIKADIVPWKYDAEVAQLQKFDIGVMPMPDNEWTRGKLGCKMLQYMAVGVPAVVSYTPTNAEIIEDGICGFFARTEDEWLDVLARLIGDRKLREDIGSRGRKVIEDKCSLSGNVHKYMKLFGEFIKNSGKA